MPRACAATTSTWSLPWTLPTTTSSGPQSRFAARVRHHHRHAERGELLAHRRIHGGVGATHLVARRREQPRHGTHAGAADADEVDLHDRGADPTEVPSSGKALMPTEDRL